MMQHISQLLGKPSLLKDACDDSALTLSHRHVVQGHCACCQTMTQSSYNPIFEASVSSELRKPRRKNHRLRHQTQFVRKFACNLTWLSCSVRFSLQATRGAGGFSISPTLTVRGVVRPDSPAFSVLERMKTFAGSLEQGEQDAMSVIRDLRIVFDRGEASPTEVLPNGDTLMHVSPVTVISIGRGTHHHVAIVEQISY